MEAEIIRDGLGSTAPSDTLLVAWVTLVVVSSTPGAEARNAFRAFYSTDPDFAAKYDRWVAAYPKSYVARLARAIYYKKRGREESGGKYIAETSRVQIEQMDSSFSKAIKDFGASIPMSPKPFLSYLHMLDIGRQHVTACNSRVH